MPNNLERAGGITDTPEPREKFPIWVGWAMRAVLLGVVLGIAALASVAWFGEPPFTAPLFYAGVILVGAGVVTGTLGVLITGRWKGE